jgi:hypothetical protein
VERCVPFRSVFEQRYLVLGIRCPPISRRTAHILIYSRRISGATGGNLSVAWRLDLSSEFHAFTKELMHHESEENKLLQQAYQEDIGEFA